MKKIIFALASVLAATAFAPEAAAVPSFARQTGMACNACHFQSFPALTSFGRAFKAGGYTMIGAQGKVEGEHGLSIPDTLNASFYIQWRYIKTNGPTTVTAPATAPNTNFGRWDMPDEMALFVGGRVSENIGFLTELATAGGAVGMANVKMPVLFDAGTTKVGFIPFSSAGIGASYGYDVFATGSSGAGRITENGMGYGAALYMGATNNAGSPTSDATGVAMVATNENYHVNWTKYTGVGNGGNAGGSFTKLGGTYMRAAWTPNIGGWDAGVGVQNWSGDPTATGPVATTNKAKLWIIDGQVQGEVDGKPLGVYASYGRASATAATFTNIYNAGIKNKTALGMMADYWVIPGTLGVQLGMMRAKTGLEQDGVVGAAAETDNSITVGARYKVRQNVKLGFAYTKFSGTAYNATGSGGANSANYSAAMAGTPERGTNRMTLILSAGL